MRLYLKFFLTHLNVQLQNRVSFALMCTGQALLAFSNLFVVLVLVSPLRLIDGFRLEEILLAGSIVLMSFSLAECFARGFDRFALLLGNGQFDRMLLQPRNIVFQVFASTMDFTRLARVGVAAAILTVSLLNVYVTNILLLAAMVVAGTTVFICLFIIYGSLCFFTTESLEFMNILTDGAREFGVVPFSFYGKSILRFLTFVIPMAGFQYYPLLALLGKAPLLSASMLLTCFIFIIPTGLLWHAGRVHYRSTGS